MAAKFADHERPTLAFGPPNGHDVTTTMLNTTTHDPYESFAEAYDQPDHVTVTRAFHERLKRMLARLPSGSRILDLGCGTGLLTELLASDGFKVMGVDRSPRMLRIARQRCARWGSRVTFSEGDFAQPIPARGFAMAVASADIVNHIPSIAILGVIFRQVRRALRPGAKLAFDSLRSWCFESYWDKSRYELYGGPGKLVMHCRWDPRRKIGTARIISYTGSNGARKRRETILNEYLHETADLREALRANGFSKSRADLWSPWPDQHLELQMDRLFWTATRD
jgi:SAM-dependent methyltransferase